MKSLLVLLALFSLTGVNLRAQRPALVPGDTAEVERTATIITGRLLRDVTRDSLTIRRAHAIVLKSVYAQIRLPRDYPDRRMKFAQLAHERDVAVRKLIKSSKGRRQFDLNAAALWPAWAPVFKQ